MQQQYWQRECFWNRFMELTYRRHFSLMVNGPNVSISSKIRLCILCKHSKGVWCLRTKIVLSCEREPDQAIKKDSPLHRMTESLRNDSGTSDATTTGCFFWLPWNTSSIDQADAVRTAKNPIFNSLSFFLQAAQENFLTCTPCTLQAVCAWLQLVNYHCRWCLAGLSMAHLMSHWGSNKGQRNAKAPRQKHWVHNKQHKIESPFCRVTEAVIPRAARVRGEADPWHQPSTLLF